MGDGNKPGTGDSGGGRSADEAGEPLRTRTVAGGIPSLLKLALRKLIGRTLNENVHSRKFVIISRPDLRAVPQLGSEHRWLRGKRKS